MRLERNTKISSAVNESISLQIMKWLFQWRGVLAFSGSGGGGGGLEGVGSGLGIQPGVVEERVREHEVHVFGSYYLTKATNHKTRFRKR